MGRKPKYANAAERLRAFRARAKMGVAPVPSQGNAKPKKAARPARVLAIENEARALLEEYQTWRDNLPESLEASTLAEKLDEAIDKLTEVAETLADIDLPRGFGRD